MTKNTLTIEPQQSFLSRLAALLAPADESVATAGRKTMSDDYRARRYQADLKREKEEAAIYSDTPIRMMHKF